MNNLLLVAQLIKGVETGEDSHNTAMRYVVSRSTSL
jgi:hypothetical protein